MRLFLICIFSILFSSSALFAQGDADSTSIAPEISRAVRDSIAAANDNFEFSIVIDYGKLITLPMGFEKKYQGGVAIKINRKIGIGGEYGMIELTPQRPYTNADTWVKGSYYGGYVQYYFNIDHSNSLYAGFGFSKGDYEDKLTYIISSDIWGDFIKTEQRSGLSASWFTVRLGSEQKFSRFFTLGGTFMLRIINDFTSVEGITPYAIPGYGIAGPNAVPAFNAYIRISLL